MPASGRGKWQGESRLAPHKSKSQKWPICHRAPSPGHSGAGRGGVSSWLDRGQLRFGEQRLWWATSNICHICQGKEGTWVAELKETSWFKGWVENYLLSHQIPARFLNTSPLHSISVVLQGREQKYELLCMQRWNFDIEILLNIITAFWGW